MVEDIAFENGWNSNFERPVTLILTLDRVILHTAVYHSSTSTSTPNFIEIKQFFVNLRTYVLTHTRMDGRTFEIGFIRSTLFKSRPKNGIKNPKKLSWCRESHTMFHVKWRWHTQTDRQTDRQTDSERPRHRPVTFCASSDSDSWQLSPASSYKINHYSHISPWQTVVHSYGCNILYY